MKRVYLDHAATTPLLNVVKNTTIKQLDMFGNASSLHIEGRAAKEAIERARRQVAELIGARAEEITFTSGGTEANNMVFNTFWGQRTVISAIEHPSVFEPFLHGAGKKMTYGNVVPVDGQGRVKFEMLDNIFSDKKIKPRPA
ncbi:MAG: aminotransferase class V-fold PLP-dependent enzyme, partial [Candidatus Nomurabacteria bacterium]|nr:aminotransferase class V-fold PLP-dependent enzyme [Candidatus Nomurabacteria bacterium]